ncbi:hypothetical protein HanPSC8_Chr13g0589501 [Helianthus annuus]|nr:hypothetical protein HanPSC8_Chr13g0589501 [Helianthus annuus]
MWCGACLFAYVVLECLTVGFYISTFTVIKEQLQEFTLKLLYLVEDTFHFTEKDASGFVTVCVHSWYGWDR